MNHQPETIKLHGTEMEKFVPNSLLRRFVYRCIVQPILNRLPAGSQSRIRRTHKMANDVIEHRTSHKALDILYSDGYRDVPHSLWSKFARAIWMNTDNVKGVRNRLAITEYEIDAFVQRHAKEQGGSPLRLLSIASGSARSFVDVLQSKKGDNLPHSVQVTFLDKSRDALAYSQELVAAAGLLREPFLFEWKEGSANAFLRSLETSAHYNLIEMVGLMDYFDTDKVAQTMRSIFDHLVPGGVLVTANILPNREQPFITDVVDWHMQYRTPQAFADCAVRAGFSAENIVAYIEPLGVHVVLVAKR